MLCNEQACLAAENTSVHPTGSDEVEIIPQTKPLNILQTHKVELESRKGVAIMV